MPRLGTATPPTQALRAEQLVYVVEVNLRKLADPGLDLPLDLIDRVERALHNGHLANVLRIDSIVTRTRHALLDRIVAEVGA